MEKSTWTLDELARRLEGRLFGPGDFLVTGVAPLEAPEEGKICVLWDRNLLASLPPSVPLVAPRDCLEGERFGVEVDDPRSLFPEVLALFRPFRRHEPGVDRTAVVAPGAFIAPSAHVGPLCVIRTGAVIGEEAVLEALVYVGEGVTVGRRTRIEPQVSLYDGTSVGDDVLIHGGTVIGSDGFGFIPDFDGGHRKIPQLGSVRIEEDVEIGASVSIDRGTVGDTVIGRGTKIDDQVHIGHNAKVGAHCILVAMTGLSGSSVLEEGVTMAARSGVKDHVRVGRRAQVAAMGGATHDIAPGAVVSGFPARDHRQQLRGQAALQKLPELLKKVRDLEARLAALEEKSRP